MLKYEFISMESDYGLNISCAGAANLFLFCATLEILSPDLPAGNVEKLGLGLHSVSMMAAGLQSNQPSFS